MKYVIAFILTATMSAGAFALGQSTGADLDCCRKETGGCKRADGSPMPQCGSMRNSDNSLKRDTSSSKKNSSSKSSGIISQ